MADLSDAERLNQEARLGRELVEILSHHCGESFGGEPGTSEGAVETLNRIIRQRDQAQMAGIGAVKEVIETVSAPIDALKRKIYDAEAALALSPRMATVAEDVQVVHIAIARIASENAEVLRARSDVGVAADRIINYMLDRGPIAPSSELRAVIRTELEELRRAWAVESAGKAAAE